MKKRLSLIGGLVALIAGGILLTASPAGATNGDLQFSQDCDKVYVTIVSHYTEGPIHINIDAPVNAGGDVGPNQTKTFPFGWMGAVKYTVVVTSSNGHLNGQAPGTKFTHVFTKDADCTTPTTPVATTPPTTTCEQAIPGRDDCGSVSTPPSTVSPPVTEVPTTTATVTPNPPSITPAPVVVQQGPPRTPSALPVTGTGTTVLWIAICVAIIGTACILVPKIVRR